MISAICTYACEWVKEMMTTCVYLRTSEDSTGKAKSINHGLKYSETENQEEVQTKDKKGIHYS